MAPHSSTLDWKIPWTEEPGRLQSKGSLSWTRLSDFTFTFHFHALEKEMATHSSVPAWRIPGTGEPGGLPSVGLQRVGHNWSDLVAAAAYIHPLPLEPPSHTPIPPLYVITEHRTEELNFLCYRAASCWLAILHMAVYICHCYSQFLPPSPSPTVYFTIYHI